MPAEERPLLHLVRSGAAPAKAYPGQELVELAATPTFDPRKALQDMRVVEKSLRRLLEEKFKPFDVVLEEGEDVVARDRYGHVERRYTRAHGPGVEVALLQIPREIIGDGTYVGSVDEIRTAFAGKTVRIFSPDEDAGEFSLEGMFEDWNTERDIEARFIPWKWVKVLEEGKYEIGKILHLELQRVAAGAGPVAVPAEVKKGRVFISYSRADREWLEELILQLKPILRKGQFSVWVDTEIKAGDHWGNEIEEALAAATVAVLLVSKHFLGSNFIQDKELPPLMKAAKERGLKILWVYLSACNYEETSIKAEGIQAAHRPLEPLEGLDKADRNRVLKEISQEIKKAATGEGG